MILQACVQYLFNNCVKLIITRKTEKNEINSNNTFDLNISLDNTELTSLINIGVSLEQITCLTLSDCKLTILPLDLFCCNLIELDVSNNLLKNVPDLLYYLKNLKNLNLSHNKLEKFDVEPKCSINLRHLDISYNLFETIPFWIFSVACNELESLKLSWNPFFPLPLFNGRYLKKLQVLELNNSNIKQNNYLNEIIKEVPKLQHLHLSNININNHDDPNNYYLNSIQALEFQKFKCKSYLVELQLSRLGLSVLPDEIIHLTCLKVLNISHNYITWLPTNFVQLNTLQVLNISNNDLIAMPENINELINLKELHVAYNIIGTIPKTIAALKYLEIFDCYHNDVLENIESLMNEIPSLKCLDLEQNYFKTTSTNKYLKQRDSLRNNISTNRLNGMKTEFEEDSGDGYFSSSSDNENIHSNDEQDDECNETEETENWDFDTDTYINNDNDLELPPFKFKAKIKPKRYNPFDFIDPIYFEDAPNDRT